MYKKERPILLSVIAILEMLAGIVVLVLGAMFIIFSMGVLGEDFASVWEETFATTFGAVFGILAVGILFVGFLIFMLGYGLWKLNLAAWFVNIILYGLSSLSIVMSFSTILTDMQTGGLSVLIQPAIIIVLFIYFLAIRDKFS
ncbi:MAG: hypothetical protein ACXAC6_02200 [Candidatus Hodarchaeales archaeon]|jgi:hypothetical protein